MKSTGAMGMSAKIALGLIVVIALGSSQSFAAPQTLSGNGIQFTRCDNSKEPIGKIEISACKDQKEFCIFKHGTAVTAEFEFTPEETHECSSIGLDFGGAAVGAKACNAEGSKGPFEAGVKQHIKAEISMIMNTHIENKVKLFLSDDEYLSKPYWYCVEFPARFVQ